MCSATCPYLKAQREGKQFQHKNSLPEAVLLALKPVFQDLAHPDLLERCLQGYTQNSNESLNNMIWRFAPKKKNHGLVTVRTAVSLAVEIFNDRAVTLAATMRELGLNVGVHATRCFKGMDSNRVKNVRRHALAATHEARIKKRQQRLHQDENQAEAEGFPYLAGAH